MRKTLNTIGLATLALASALIWPGTAGAETSKKDVLVASRALNFITPKADGTVTAAIIYDASDAASKADADALVATIGDKLKAGKVSLTAKLVDIANLGDLGGARIAFIAKNTSAHHGAIADALVSSGVLAASTDLSCVESGKCALGVRTSPKVEIFVNKAAAGAAGVDFLPAFLMMVKEV